MYTADYKEENIFVFSVIHFAPNENLFHPFLIFLSASKKSNIKCVNTTLSILTYRRNEAREPCREA